MKNGKTTWVFFLYKSRKFWSVSSEFKLECKTSISNLNDWIYTIDGKLDKIPHGANLIKFTEHQRKELINWYDCNSGSSPVGDDVATLMKRTGLSAKQIKHFMEYRRKQDRKG